MIIGRLLDDLKLQNWTKLTLELLVLVVGVFLGLQIDDWNENRKEALTEHLYLERLLADTERSIDLQTADIEVMNEFIDGHKTILRALQTGEIPEDDFASLHRLMISPLAGYPALNRDTSTLFELQSFGGLGMISNVELRQQLGQLLALSEWIDNQNEFFRDRTVAINEAAMLMWLTDYDLEVISNDADRPLKPVMAFGDIAGNLEYRSLIARSISNKSRGLRWFHIYMNATIALRDALTAELQLTPITNE
jgi:hypothetical protein